MSNYHQPEDGRGRKRIEGGSLSFSDLFLYEPRAIFPNIGQEEVGIRLSVELQKFENELMYVNILVTNRFKEDFADCFHDLYHALTLLIERPYTGQNWQINLSDPNVTRLDYEGMNFDVSRVSDTGFLEETYCEIPAVLPITTGLDEDVIYMRVVLQNYTSNVLSIHNNQENNVDYGYQIASYLYGMPHQVSLLGDGVAQGKHTLEYPEAVEQFEKVKIDSIERQDTGDKGEYRLYYSALMSSDESKPEFIEWLKTLYISVVTEAFQFSAVELLINQRIIFEEDIEEIPSHSGAFGFRGFIELSDHLSRNFTPEGYYIQLSGTHYHSKTHILRVNS